MERNEELSDGNFENLGAPYWQNEKALLDTHLSSIESETSADLSSSYVEDVGFRVTFRMYPTDSEVDYVASQLSEIGYNVEVEHKVTVKGWSEDLD